MGLRCGWGGMICLARRMSGPDSVNVNENISTINLSIMLTVFMPCAMMYGFTASAMASGLHLALMSSLNSLDRMSSEM